jgi:hypothetical protein
MPNYENTGDAPTPKQLATKLRKHIKPNTKQLALSQATDKSIVPAVLAHRVLDVVAIESIEAAIGDAIPIEYICKSLHITVGQFWSWVNADDERNRRIEKAQVSVLQDLRVKLYSDVMNMGKIILEEEQEVVKLKLKAAEAISGISARQDTRKKDNDGVMVNIDFGSLFAQ